MFIYRGNTCETCENTYVFLPLINLVWPAQQISFFYINTSYRDTGGFLAGPKHVLYVCTVITIMIDNEDDTSGSPMTADTH